MGHTHVALLADVMTNTGNIISIDRHGLNRLDTDPLSRATFEQPVDHLIQAAVFGETDHIRSVSSCVAVGKVFNGGTGLPKILMDNDMLENTEYNINSLNKYTSKLNFNDNPLIDDILNKEEDMIMY